MRRPDNLLYWLDEVPPARFALGLALQQAAFLCALLAVPALFARNLGLEQAQFMNLAACCLIYSAFAVLLQAWGRLGIGAGVFLPLQGSTSVLPLFGLAVASESYGGGFGMFAISGLAMVVFSFIIQRFKAIFTVEVAGLAMLLIGSGIGIIGLKLIFAGDEGVLEAKPLIVAGFSLCVMVICNVWVKHKLRLFATVIGLGVGLMLSYLLGTLPAEDLAAVGAASIFKLPQLQQFGWEFEPDLTIPAMITGFSLSLTSMGVQTVTQRFNDADFNRPDLKSIGSGVRAEGIAQIFASLINALPMAASGGAASLAMASGCTSRHLAKWTAGLLLLVALCPKIIVFWLILPPEVLGALFLFLSSFATIGGIQMIGMRMLDNRRSLAVGLAFLVGLTYSEIHAKIDSLVPAARYIDFSQFALALTIAVTLQAIFRIGITRRSRQVFRISDTHFGEMIDFIEAQGRLWGARFEAVKRAELASWQAFELLTDNGLIDPSCEEMEIEAHLDEHNLTIFVRYMGELPELTTRRPSHEEMIDDPMAARHMAGYLINRLADGVRTSRHAGQAEIRLSFKD